MNRFSSARHVLATVGLVAALAAVAVTTGTAQQAAVQIDEPADGSYVSGPFTIRARVVPTSAVVAQVTFYVDGRMACASRKVPFECIGDAGPSVAEHLVRVVAQLADGTRLVRTIRTKGATYTESVDVDAVPVALSVTDKHGKFVRNLPRDVFHVFEDGVPQTIASFVAENVPLEILVAVDMSSSMTMAMPAVKQAVTTFLRALRPQDRVTMLAFNESIFTIAQPNQDLDARLKAVDRLEPWGGTAFYEVLMKATETQQRATGRKAIVVFTDGEDRNSQVTRAAAERAVESSDSLLYVVGLGRGAWALELMVITQKLAMLSGGRAFFADKVEKLGEPFAAIVEELSKQYLIGYAPMNARKDGTWRAIRVDVDNKDYRVRARQGYRAVEKVAK